MVSNGAVALPKVVCYLFFEKVREEKIFLGIESERVQ